MDYKIIWTDEAVSDVEEIVKYIAKDSSFYARSVMTKILDTTRLLETVPYIGRVVPEEGNESVRELFVYSYRIIYEIDAPLVYILAIVHGKRILYPEFKKRIREG